MSSLLTSRGPPSPVPEDNSRCLFSFLALPQLTCWAGRGQSFAPAEGGRKKFGAWRVGIVGPARWVEMKP